MISAGLAGRQVTKEVTQLRELILQPIFHQNNAAQILARGPPLIFSFSP